MELLYIFTIALIISLFYKQLFQIILKIFLKPLVRFCIYLIDLKCDPYWDRITETIPIYVDSRIQNRTELEKSIQDQLSEKLKQFETGSMLVIQNKGDFICSLVRIAGRGRFSHSAMYIEPGYFNSPEFRDLIPMDTNTNSRLFDAPLLWQAAGEKKDDYNCNDAPDLHSLSKYLLYYMQKYPNSRYIIRNLHQKLDSKQSHSLKSFIYQTITEKRLNFCSNFELFFTYYSSKLSILPKLLDGILNIKRTDLTFCSKILTETFQHIGLIDLSINSNKGPNYFGYPYHTNVFQDESEIQFIYI
ncbi:hypothetical protein DLAC_02068 [Tieghemostelium lacteum]|uniref:Uncharacterized protein n=1 Tax=Tieghemostelium lacteum TaxID=361077 RepID=A0A152A4K7_TIELA|nr:hypothetical protein DLAC_02068 [Tieghemostelium lacteum]|eukprot:KYR00991.1 hypothetical protein DLAC_02068 [Tieghemostelium lacteum]